MNIKVVCYAIVVTYNGAKWIDMCFGRLLNSTIPVKIIAVDNGSSDGTLDILREKFPDVTVIEMKKNLGFGGANNIGMKIAQKAGADYVFLLNQDAWVELDTIEKLVRVAKRHPQYGIVSPLHLTGSGEKLDKYFLSYILPQNCPELISDMGVRRLKNKIYKVDFVNAAAWLISKKTIETIGGFSPIYFAYCEDDNYIHRLHFHGLELGIYPHSIIYHDRENRSLSPYFTDQFELEFRRAILKYSNPGEENTIFHFIIHLYKHIFLNILLLRFTRMYNYYKLLRMIVKLGPEIEETKKQSRMTGSIFL